MNWLTIIDRVRGRVGEAINNNKFFRPDDARMLISDRQIEMTRRIKVLEAYTQIPVGTIVEGDAATPNVLAMTVICPDVLLDNGYLYWSASIVVGGTIVRNIILYSDYGKTTAVASASFTAAQATAQATIDFTELNTSGVTGTVQVRSTFCASASTAVMRIRCGEEYTLPEDFLEVLSCKYNDTEIEKQRYRRPRILNYDQNDPVEFFLVGANKISFWPNPVSPGTIHLRYIRRSCEYAFDIKYANPSGKNITACTAAKTATAFSTHTRFSGSASCSKSYALATYPKLGDLITAVNALTMSSGVSVIQCATTPSTKRTDGLENYDTLTVSTTASPTYFDIELPVEMHPTLVEGVIEAFREKDREYSASAMSKSKYEQLVRQHVAYWDERRKSITSEAIGNAYSNGGSGFSNQLNYETQYRTAQ